MLSTPTHLGCFLFCGALLFHSLTPTQEDPTRQIEIALVNGRRAFVLAGHPETLHTLAMLLQKLEVKRSGPSEQTRVPFSKRKHEFMLRYLPVSVPFHSARHLHSAVDLILADAQRIKFDLQAEQLRVPVYSTEDGSDLRTCVAPESATAASSLLRCVVRLQCSAPVNWEAITANATTEKGVTHLVDFGPGNMAGAGALYMRERRGNGVQVILAATQGRVPAPSGMLDRSFLFDVKPSAVLFAPNWEEDFRPRLVRRRVDQELVWLRRRRRKRKRKER
jgi:fatty acid synthase subunit beta, fungi type